MNKVTLKSIFNEVIRSTTKDKKSWDKFLKFASGIYKYDFSNALLIYAQRPSAKMVANMNVWNEKLGRYIRKGSKGIVALSRTNDKIYLFDVEDTIGSKESLPKLWKITESNKELIKNKLVSSYNIKDDNLENVLKSVVEKEINEILANKINSFENMEQAKYWNCFFETALQSCNTLVLTRCGLNIESNDYFKFISAFNNTAALSDLGIVVWRTSKKILRKIEREIENELSRERGNSLSRNRNDNIRGSREIRENGNGLSSQHSTKQIHRTSDEGRIETNDDKNRQGGKSKTSSINGAINEGEAIEQSKFTNTIISREKANRIDSRGNSIERNSISKKIDYLYEDEEIEVGVKSKFKNNIEAIKVLKNIENEGRMATSGEQDVLAKYVGWGGLSQAFDVNNKLWIKEYEQLKGLLSNIEYENARASTTTAFYTPNIVIKGIYKFLNKANLNEGKILDPAMGIGKFFGNLRANKNYELYGIELDSISGRIAKQLYQNANINITGFEESSFQDNYFDGAIGNIPFGDYKIYDKEYSKNNFLIHDYFFAKTLDKVKDNGIIAFVTSKGTLDKENPSFRKYLAERAELLGAIRLPSKTFGETEATADIIFLRKKKVKSLEEPDWVFVNKNEDGIIINEYFINNPDMMLGKMKYDNRMFGENSKYTILENDDKNFNLEEALSSAINKIQIEKYEKTSIEEQTILEEESKELLPATSDIKNYTYTIVKDSVYYRENQSLRRMDFDEKTKQRIQGMHEIRTIVRNIIKMQLENCTDEELSNEQEMLNYKYDKFIKKYDYISSPANNKAFRDDDDYALLSSLEVINEDSIKKADIFNKRTISPKEKVTMVNTALEGLIICLNEKGKVDLNLIAKLYKKDENTIIEELKSEIFLNPVTEKWETKDEYLSGDVRKKLKVAKAMNEQNGKFQINIEALEKVIPEFIPASEIGFRIGSTWIEASDIEAFMYEKFDTPNYYRHSKWDEKREIKVFYNEFNSSWAISNKGTSSSILTNETYGTNRINSYYIMEDTLNLRDVVVKDKVEVGEKEKYVINQNETMLAKEKQKILQMEFREWLLKEPERRKKYETLYNEKFNNIRLREFDGSNLKFPGMTNDIVLRKHQLNAIARGIYSPNTLLAHCVGAGKSFEMIAICMEKKRLKLANKSIMVVPNHLTEQMGSEFLRLYPTANILVTTKKDFAKENRKKFISRIATGNYDAVIIGHSQFEKIPMSKERQEEMINRQIHEITAAIEEIKHSNGDKWSIKQMEKFKKSLEGNMKKLLDSPKDDVINFEELGIDSLFVDEAHSYKNCAVFSKMRNVAGISNTNAKKSSDMLMKCQYIQEKNNGGGVVFATGTPISNSMTEMFVMQRYLQPIALKERGISHFDSWAANFGETVSALELAPEGTGYRMKNRFSKFTNLPELMTMFKEVADVQTPDMLKLPVPKLKDGKYKMISSEPSEFTKEVMADFVIRAEGIRNGMVKPNEDNMLKITNEARLLGTDPRLIDVNAENYPDSKVNKCINNIFEEYNNSSEIKGTQLVFCDVGTPNSNGKWSIYDYIKGELIKLGIPNNEISFIHEANTDSKRDKLFSDMRSGKKRILIGSTQKCGVGTNIQDRMVALHHLDCPYRPADIFQREGRLLRQGNLNSEVNIYRYVTKDTFDSYLWQLVENKQKFISQIMTSKTKTRDCEDIDETVLNFSEVKALATGNPLIKEKMDLDNDISRLRLLKSNFDTQKYSLEDKVNFIFPKQLKENRLKLSLIENDIATRNKNKVNDEFNMTIRGRVLNKREDVGAIIVALCEKNIIGEIGELQGFKISIEKGNYKNYLTVASENGYKYNVEFSESPIGNVRKIENVLLNLESKRDKLKRNIESIEKNSLQAKLQLEKTFPYSEELKLKELRQTELNELLSMDTNKENNLNEMKPELDEIVKEAENSIKKNAVEKPKEENIR